MQYSPLAGAGQRPSQSVSLPKECPVDISQDCLRHWRAGVPRGRRPMASLGTAQRLAPMHSGLPLCETCLSSPHHWTDTHQAIFSTLRYQIKMEMTVVLWCRDRLWKKEKSSHFDRFSLSETGCSCITPMRSIGQSCAVSGTLFFSSPCLFNPPICQRFSVIFSCYFCLSFSGSLSISAKRHKNSSHKHFSNS